MPDHQDQLPITICIPVRNEEKNLGPCFESIGSHFAEVVVADSFSTDSTRSIAESNGAKVVDFKWNGGYPKKRNWMLQEYKFETPWVLFLDADERITAEFVEELRRVIPSTDLVGFWISYNNWFMLKRLRYGDQFRKLSLFRVGAGEYERFGENLQGILDIEVHEHPVLDGEVGAIQARLEHHEYRGMEHYIAKHNAYSSWEAKRCFLMLESPQQSWQEMTRRQRFKYAYLDRWWLGLFYFFISYVVKLGFLDGRAGWYFNRLKTRYFADIRLKIIEIRQSKK